MSVEVRIIGPDSVGCPAVIMSTDDGYNPDAALDLKNRAVDAYKATFGDIYQEPFFAPVTEDEDETTE
jgi:hypothetical protein